MSRHLVIALLVSLLLHGAAAASGFLLKKKPAQHAAKPEIPTLELNLPPPPEPEEPPVSDDAPPVDAPGDIADFAPPMQNDVPTATLDSAFTQRLQPALPAGLPRPTGTITIPTTTKPALGGGKGLGNIFDLASLDQRPEPRVRIAPVYPYDLKRAAISGRVTVGFIVDANGDVRDPYIIESSNAGFDQAAMDAVLKWKFKPGKKGGAAVNTRMSVPLIFNLSAK